jgi:hypothetical protein
LGIKRLVGKYFELLNLNLSVSTGSVVNGAGALEADGCAPHVCTIEEAKIYIEGSGEIYIAILHDGDKIMYFTNNQTYNTKLIAPIKNFANSFPNTKVIFMNK